MISFSPPQLPSLYMHKPIFTNGYLSLCLIQLILSFKAVLTECSRLRLKERIAKVFKTGNLQGYLWHLPTSQKQSTLVSVSVLVNFFRSQSLKIPQSTWSTSPSPPFHLYHLGVFYGICTLNFYFFFFKLLLSYSLESTAVQVMVLFHRFLRSARNPRQPMSTPEISSENAQKSPWKYWHRIPVLGGFLSFASLS